MADVDLRRFTYDQAAREVVERVAQLKAALSILEAAEAQLGSLSGSDPYAVGVREAVEDLKNALPEEVR
jgi:hypothetical protein